MGLACTNRYLAFLNYFLTNLLQPLHFVILYVISLVPCYDKHINNVCTCFSRKFLFLFSGNTDANKKIVFLRR